jgi:hypothetical protein
MFFDVYVLELLCLKLLRLETITFSDATLSDIIVVLCYFLSQYRPIHIQGVERQRGRPKSYDNTETLVLYVLYPLFDDGVYRV